MLKRVVRLESVRLSVHENDAEECVWRPVQIDRRSVFSMFHVKQLVLAGIHFSRARQRIPHATRDEGCPGSSSNEQIDHACYMLPAPQRASGGAAGVGLAGATCVQPWPQCVSL